MELNSLNNFQTKLIFSQLWGIQTEAGRRRNDEKKLISFLFSLR